MLCAKFDATLFAILKVVVKKQLVYFSWTRCVVIVQPLTIRMCKFYKVLKYYLNSGASIYCSIEIFHVQVVLIII